MQNPFLRLKHYRTDQSLTDSKENHATEVLAACLVLSENLRADFLDFLFRGVRAVDRSQALALEVRTQEMIEGGQWVDLVIEEEAGLIVALEVKVGAPELAKQIRDYRKWLDQHTGRETHLFSLVKSPDPSFHIKQHGGHGRRTWKDLYDTFSANKKRYADTLDANLIEHFCNYLEAEQIVSTWNPSQIPHFGVGVTASNALHSAFQQLETKLIDSNPDFEPKIVFKENEWPRLEVGMKSWQRVFGTTTDLKRLFVFWKTSAIWEGDKEGFYFEIKLWNKYQRGDWVATQKKLLKWITTLKTAKFYFWADLKRRSLEMDEILAHTFAEPPTQVVGCSEDDAISILLDTQINALSDAELVQRLYERVLFHCDLISKLA